MSSQTPHRQYSQRELLARLLALALRHWPGCLVLVAQQAVLALLTLAGLGAVGLGVDYVRWKLAPDGPVPHFPLGWVPPASWPPMRVLLLVSGGMAGIAVLRAWLGYWSALTNNRLGQAKIVVDLRKGVYSRMQRLSFRFFDAHTTGPLINRVSGDTQSVRLFVDGVLVQSVSTLLSFVFYLACLLRIHPVLTVACLAPLPFTWLAVIVVSGLLRRDYNANRDLLDRLVLVFEELMRGIGVVKSFAVEGWASDRFCTANDGVRDQKGSVIALLSMLHPSVDMLNHASMTLLLGYGGWLAVQGRIPVGTGLVVFAGVLQQLAGQVNAVAGIADNLQQTLAGAQRVFEVLDSEPEVRDAADARPLSRARGHVRFEGVSFAFRENNTVLHDISLDVEAGERLAIVGPTGAGKSALIQLIPRFYDPDQGCITLDGLDLRQWNLDDVRRQVGLVFQESFLFSASIAANIAFGKPDATLEQIERAARLAAAHEFIERLPLGYDTLLQENGGNLSGGQRQRLSLARALLLDPAILILDDPTAAVDTETEAEILSALDSAMKGRTCFIIAHRLGAMRYADRILVLDEGRVAAMGTHETLAAQEGYYREALVVQAMGASLDSQAL